jgi:methyltransferase family protein
LSVLQGLQLYALCLELRPDLITELGRGYGNSTCLFAHAVVQNARGRLVSFDLDPHWEERTLPKLRTSEFKSLLPVIDARLENIKGADFAAIAGDARTIFVFWDAHGWEAADGVLCRLLPAIAARTHIVACHDLSDNRYVQVERAYNNRMFWRSAELKEITARYNLGWVNTQEPQFLPLMDFLWRNRCTLRSADEDLALWRRDHAERQTAVERAIGADAFSPGCHWGYFSLNDAPGELTFPATSSA